jgi:hypothetical protein
LNEVAFLFWLHPNQDLKQMQVQDWMVKEELLGSPQHKMKFIGSGDFHFFETIGFTMQPSAGEATHYDKAIGAIVGRATIAFTQELNDDVPHYYRYCGGFEIITLSETGFRKMPMSVAVWAYDQGSIQLIGPVYSQTYNERGVLGFRRFVRTAGVWSQTIFSIGNFLEDAIGAKFDPAAEIETGLSVHYLINRDKLNEVQFMMGRREGSLDMHLEHGQIVTRFSDHFMKDAANLTGVPFDTAKRGAVNHR